MARSTFNLGLFLEKEKLKTSGTNFMSWFRTLRILLAPHQMTYVLESAVGDAPAEEASEDDDSDNEDDKPDEGTVRGIEILPGRENRGL